jgi:hypothetical protein
MVNIIMSKLRDLYIDVGNDPERFESSTWYLAELSLRSATEIDNYLLEKDPGFGHTEELIGILERYQLKDTDNWRTERLFPYTALRRVMKRGSEKELRYYSELALEMRLLRSELEGVPGADREKLEGLRSLLLEMSRGFSDEDYRVGPRRLAA